MSDNTIEAGTAGTGRSASVKHGIVILLAAVMPPMAIISLIPVVPLLLGEFSGLEGSEFLVPIAITVPALCVALFSPIAGWISDRVGRKNLLIVSLLVYAGIGILPYFLSDLMHIIGARIGLGLAEAVIMTIATALIGDYFKGKERERWVARQFATVSISAIVLIAAGGILGDILGSRGPFLLYLLAIPIALLVAFILFEPDRSGDRESESDAKLPFARILPILMMTLFVGIIFYTITVKMGEILELVAEVSPGQIGAVGAAANIATVVGTVLFGRFKGASGPMLVLIGMVMSAVGYMGAGIAGSIAGITVSVIIACTGFGILLPTMLTWLLQMLPMNVRGRGTGLWTGVFFFGQFFAPLFAAALQTQLGDLETVLFIFAGLCAAGVVLAAFKLRGAASLLTS